MGWPQRRKGRGSVLAYMNDTTREVQQQEEPKVEMPLIACVSYLSQLINIFYTNTHLLVSLRAPRGRGPCNLHLPT